VDDSGDAFTLIAQASPPVGPLCLIEYMQTALQALVNGLEDSPDMPALAVSLMPPDERRRVIESFNDTRAECPTTRTVHELIAEQAARTPDAVALIYENTTLSYSILNHRANQLARFLQNTGVGPGQLVALCLERGIEMVVSLLGVLKSGAAYVPLDPAFPPARLAQIVRHAAPSMIVTHERLVKLLPESTARIISLDATWSEISRYEGMNPDAQSLRAAPHDLAYVIYTSGSTGTPKGVMVEHGAIVNLLCSMAQEPGLDSRDCLLAVTTIAFDIAAMEIYLPLSRGAKLALAPREITLDGRRLARMIDELPATILQATPATWQLLLNEGWSGRVGLKALCGGEALSTQLSRELLPRVGTLWNLYGPTETTIWSCRHQITPGGANGSVLEPIGHPIGNTYVYILNNSLNPVPVGVVGEIHIGGRGVARGYLGRPELTAERFLDDRFSQSLGARLYKTGDLGRWRADGSIEYLGRNDQQVKIRGFRIELGEIEGQLVRHEQVGNAVVMVREDSPGDKHLVAYVVPRTVAIPSAKQLRAHLEEVLPYYMIPAAFVIRTSIPLTPNGKTDRRALQDSDTELSRTSACEPPQGALETTLARMWSEVLTISDVGRHEDFFELGGHSLLGMRLISRISESLGISMPVISVFQYPTICKMAELIRAIESNRPEPSPPRPRPRGASVPLSFSQEWFWTSLRLENRSSMRTIAATVHISGQLDVESLRMAIAEVVRRHEALRSRIVLSNSVPQQEIQEIAHYEAQIIDLPGLSADDRDAEARRWVEKLVYEPFIVTVGPLFVATLLRFDADRHALIVAMDHIISDIASLGIFLRETFLLYEQSSRCEPWSLPKVEVQFADYAVWQRKQDQLWVERHGGYWKARLAGARRVSVFEHETRMAGSPGRWTTLPISFGEVLSNRLRQFSRGERTTPAMCMLAAYVALIFRWSGKSDITIPFTTAGRLHPQVADTIGFFGAPLFLRIELPEQTSFLDLLERITGEYATAYAHEDSCRIAAMADPRGFASNPVFNWIPREFDLAKRHISEVQTAGTVEIAMNRFEVETLRDDIEWEGELRTDLTDRTQGFSGTMSYRSDLCAPSVFERFARNLQHFATRLLSDPTVRVKAVSIET
jgi:amino acid adenylation domain-containing protein